MPSTRSTKSGDPPERWVRTVEDALQFLRDVGLCLIFEEKKRPTKREALVSLWDVVDAPDKQPGERGFGERVGVVWRLKNELPMTYPDEIFYGKLKSGRAMLCTLDRLKEIYRNQHQAIDDVGKDARRLYEIICLRPITSGDLRLDAGFHLPSDRTRFDRALQELQIALLIARIDTDPDTWFLFDAAFPQFSRVGSSFGSTTGSTADMGSRLNTAVGED
jgi:hypothetical protein